MKIKTKGWSESTRGIIRNWKGNHREAGRERVEEWVEMMSSWHIHVWKCWNEYHVYNFVNNNNSKCKYEKDEWGLYKITYWPTLPWEQNQSKSFQLKKTIDQNNSQIYSQNTWWVVANHPNNIVRRYYVITKWDLITNLDLYLNTNISISSY